MYLSVKNYDEFIKLVKKFIINDIRMSVFYEPDINEYTSVAIEPSEKSRKLTSNLSLMLKKENKCTCERCTGIKIESYYENVDD